MRIAISLLLIVALAGCFAGGTPSAEETEVAVVEAAMPLLSQNHGSAQNPLFHKDATLHAGSRNIERVAYHNGVDNSGDPNVISPGVYYTEIALHHGFAYVARGTVINAAGAGGVDDVEGGFVIIDVNDPTQPVYVGEFDALTGSDIEVTADGRLAFFATQRNSIEEAAGGAQSTEDETNPGARGIYIVDIRDKTEPVQIGFQPLPYNGPHTITYWNEGGREFLFVQTYDFYANSVPSGAGQPVGGVLGALPGGVIPLTQRVTAYEIQRDPSGSNENVALVQVAHFQIAESGSDGALIFPHDSRVEIHPLRQEAYLYVAYWDKGVRILDISNLPGAIGMPTEAQSPLIPEVGSYSRFDPSSRNNIHLAMPMDTLIDGKHITVTEPEIITANETGYIHFIDTSSPARAERPCPTSYWTLPGELIVNSLEFSPHNFDSFDGKVALAHNHAGLWIIDVSNAEKLCHPKSAGFFMDTFQRTNSPKMQPYFWGVVEDSGYLFATDEATGLYVLKYTG
jgi:hypothetical protein